MKIFIKRTK